MILKNKYEYIRFVQEFHKRFPNFLTKAPVFVTYMFTGDKVTLYSYDKREETVKLFDYVLDFSQPVKENIRAIKEKMIPYYPVLRNETVQRVEYTADELSAMISKGEISVDDVSDVYRTEVIIEEFRIEKVFVDTDQLVLRDMQTNKLECYHLNWPVVTFLRRVHEGELSRTEAYDAFKEKSEFLMEIRESTK